MSTIPIKEAIKFGGWLEYDGKFYNGPLVFRFKVLRFARPSPAEIGPRPGAPALEGVLWGLSMQVVNLNKTAISPVEIHHVMRLVDQDGFEFPVLGNLQQLEGPIAASVNRLTYGYQPLLPKIKVAGLMLFALPDEENSYSILLKDGSIKEV